MTDMWNDGMMTYSSKNTKNRSFEKKANCECMMNEVEHYVGQAIPISHSLNDKRPSIIHKTQKNVQNISLKFYSNYFTPISKRSSTTHMWYYDNRS